ncbi:hypothetical protein NDA14_005616 [Ustilago hordei]|uniref:Uncharacterized protein n=1 Tax=Ustilago hordei TaxID=120017 RepID=I2G1B4_USTHO|nr:uncharacterized protein UHO2_03391 [Ustilago hordei]KAJ1581265.1 hypothetical protein NDA15_007826 [Ustilago hordei]KAJ1583017.1 hypothetical protein NDA12_007388 [Ustilago hordei]KAJ1599933.1 hypothetical protein NDA14_005616 [Ustilago hordei]CCF52957.1 uncharacterized protein UHOR_04332 [Ustilago hordei]SYW84194.1 uncharacterized protein UHO2_03391 [Ustilago hordei]
MDEDPDFDYEMDPQAPYASMQGSAEEVMDDVRSEGMPMSDAGMQSKPIDKASYDVDFHDSANTQHASSDVQFSTEAPESESSGYIVDGQIAETSHGPSEDHVYESGPTITVGEEVKAPEEAFPTGTTAVQTHQESSTIITAGVTDENGERNDAADQWQGNSTENDGEYVGGGEEEEEQDELNQGVGGASAHDGTASAAIVKVKVEEEEEADQLEGEGEQEQQISGAEAHTTQTINGGNTEEYYDPDDHEIFTVCVTFNGQDFVMWSSTDIPAYVALSTKPQEAETDDKVDELMQIEAPALDVPQSVLGQPLDSLFAGLRERKALGEFLEETHELHLNFPDLDLDIAEDNLYCREITLGDLLQLHHGLGLETSLHVQVSERPRFITKYNELAQHVAGIIGNQLQHSSDEEDEIANAGLQVGDYNGVAGDEESVALQNGRKPNPPQQVSVAEVQANKGHGARNSSEATRANVLSTTEATVVLSEPKANALPEGASLAHAADGNLEVASEAGGGSKPTASQTEEHSLHAQVGEGDIVHEEQDELEGDTAGTVAEQHDADGPRQGEGQDGAPEDACGSEQHAGAAEEEVIDLAAEDDEEEVIDLAAEDDEEDEYDEDEVEGEQYEDEVEGEEYQEEAEGEEYDEEAEAEKYEDYGDQAGEIGEEAERTFYTTVNEGSGAEEDELEEPEEATVEEDNGAALLHNAHPAEARELTNTNGGDANNEQAWEGTLSTPRTAVSPKAPTDKSIIITNSQHLCSITEGAEEQIVEYIEGDEDNINAASSSLPTSETYDMAAQRKRSFLDEDDTAEYEEDDREAESKRVKMI